jgi:hypothetical protein
VIVICYTIWRIVIRDAVAEKDKKEFQVALGGRATTPQTAVFSEAQERP